MVVSNIRNDTTRTGGNEGKIDIDIEDEISFVLHEFRQSSSSSSSATGPCSNIIKNNNRNSKSHRGYFSDVRYYRNNRTIGVSYLIDKVLLFEFEICIQIICLDVGGGDDDIDDNHTKNENEDKSKNHHKLCYTVTYKTKEDYGYSSISSTECSLNNTKFFMKEKMSILKRRVQIICDELNYCLNEDAEQSKRKNSNNHFHSFTSLFAVLSKLLLLLNNLQTELLSCHQTTKKNNNEKDNALVLRQMTDRERSSHIAYLSTNTIMMKMMSTKAKATTRITKSNNNKEFRPGITVDLALLLLRFALVGKHRDVFLNPIPPITTEHDSDQSFGSASVANKIWLATEYRRRYRQKKQPQQQRTSLSSSMVLLHPIEQELFGFLYTLPWIKRGNITTTLMNSNVTSSSSSLGAATATAIAAVNHEMIESNKKVIRVKDKNMDNSGRNRIVIEVCLDLENNITTTTAAIDNANKHQQNNKNEDDYETRNDSYYSPRFARLCKLYGVVTVYHGTHIDHVWSILNNGFWSMSDNPLFCKNGAIMGSGVYLSTSKKVAQFFATNNSSKNANKIRTAFKHDSLRNILLLVENNLCFDNDGDCDGDDEKRKKDLDEYYDISCYSVFEARIIRPPNDDNNNNQNDNKNGDERAAAESKSPTRRDGKYYVVPNGQDIRITRLHLTFELTRKRSNFLLKFLSFLQPNNNRSMIVYYAFLVVLISIFFRYVTTKRLL